MLISPAYAQAAGAPGAFDLISFLPLILIFVVFYFLLIRPQQKRMKEHQAMLAAIAKGDRIVTGGGILANVVKVEDDGVLICEIAQNVRVKVLRATVQDVLKDDAKAANANQPAAKGSDSKGQEGETPQNGAPTNLMGKLLGKK